MYFLLLTVIYAAFICLGLPDSLLGAAWPSMYDMFGVPISYVGIPAVIISVNTVISSLMSERLTRRFSTALITAVSVAVTAASVIGFSFAESFAVICVIAVPYGLGAGSIDAALNNYVALHYKSRHMSWLHCMWGVGTICGPYILRFALSSGHSWASGYKIIGLLLAFFTLILFISIPIWDKKSNQIEPSSEPTTVFSAFKMPGAFESVLTFFCYCGLEQTTMLWASSYMVLHKGISSTDAAGYAGLFFIGITAGRFINGFLTFKFSDTFMIRAGQVLILLGICALLLPGKIFTLAGLIIIGLGCAPIYPCIIHSTPERFGAERSQAVIGIQMASAYTGTCLMPPLFGLIAKHIGINLLPFYLFVLLAVMVGMHEKMIRKIKQKGCCSV